jgi:hypothetical protein
MSCIHRTLHVHSEVFDAPVGDGTQAEALRIRAVHLHVSCETCGMPFKFVGARPPPEDPLDFLQGGAPWASAQGDEMAAWITPAEAPDFLTVAPEGRA